MGKSKHEQIEAVLAESHVEKPPKNPKVPTFNSTAAATAQKLREIIDAGGEQAPLAYGALTRLSVLWAQNNGVTDRSQVLLVGNLITIMGKLFPNGEGLPEVNDP